MEHNDIVSQLETENQRLVKHNLSLERDNLVYKKELSNLNEAHKRTLYSTERLREKLERSHAYSAELSQELEDLKSDESERLALYSRKA